MIFVILILTLLILWYFHKKSKLNYFKQHGFPTLGNSNIIFGDCGAALTMRKSFLEVYYDAHRKFKEEGHKVGGIYLMQIPMLIVTDNDLTKKILQTDFDSFNGRGITVDPINNPLAEHLFNLDGEAWQKLRKKLSPTFTTGKMKGMFPIMEKHVDVLIKVTEGLIKNVDDDIAYAEWLDKTGIDIIGHVAFGLDCNTLEGGNEDFFEMTHKIMRPKIWKLLKMMFSGLSNPANVVTLFSSDEEVTTFFIDLFTNAVQHRRREKIVANDFLQLLMEVIDYDTIETNETSTSGLTMIQAAAQAFLFFVAGYETTSRTVVYTLYALAEHQEIQDKLRTSLQKDLKANQGNYTYELVMNNEYLDMVLKETLRRYPPVMVLNRIATRDYKLEESGLVIPKGIPILISTFGIHLDPDNFTNPLHFDPERFNKKNSDELKPFTNLPFGEGPRVCIGKMLGFMQSKLMLAKIILNFQLLQSDKTEYPLQMSPLTTNLLLTSRKPLYFKFKSIN